MIQTLCPACSTTFRVTLEQLKAKQGKVRCGRCQHVFNAIETLHDATVEHGSTPPIDSQPEFDAMQAPMPDAIEVEPAVAAATIDPPAGTYWPTVEPRGRHEAAPRRDAWPWALAAVATLLLLLLQLTVQYRVELSVLAPTLKPLLSELCQPLGCDLPLPHLSDLVSIESSDLHPDGQQKDQLILVATLKNRAPFAQAYPDLELTLTDTLDKAVLRKVLVPVEYLAKETANGFAGNSEIAVNLSLKYDNADSLPATGYRLYLFYP